MKVLQQTVLIVLSLWQLPEVQGDDWFKIQNAGEDIARNDTGVVIKTIQAPSVLSCVQRCKRNTKCENINFDEETGSCVLLDGSGNYAGNLKGITASRVSFFRH